MLIISCLFLGAVVALEVAYQVCIWLDNRADLARRRAPPVETGPCVECGQLQPWPQGKVRCAHCGAALYYWP